MKKRILTQQEIAVFCRNLSLLVQAGLPLSDSVLLMAKEENGICRDIYETMGELLDRGIPLGTATAESNVFPAYVSGMIQTGERTGRLEEALISLADYYECRCRISRLMRNALVFPSMVLGLMVIVIAVLLIKVLPIFEAVYRSLGSRLTGIAARLLQLGQFLHSALPVLFLLLILGIALVLLFTCCSTFRRSILTHWKQRFGDRGVSAKFNNAQFARALAMGMRSGLSPEESLEQARVLLSDVPVAASRCDKCTEDLAAGANLTTALEANGFLPAASCRMLTVGMQGGNGDRVMARIADQLMEDAEQSLESMVAKVEPAMVLVASLMVGLILLSVMLPLANILSSLG